MVTDSTASLPRPMVGRARHRRWCRCRSSSAARAYDDGVDPGPARRTWRRRSRSSCRSAPHGPSPAVMLEAYERAAAAGAEEIVSVHVCAQVSGTYESARPGRPTSSGARARVDSRQIGAGTGFAALTAAEAAAGGGRGRRPRRRPAAGRGRPRRCSTSTRWSTSAAAAGSELRPRSSAPPWRSSPSSPASHGRIVPWRRCARPARPGPARGACRGRGGGAEVEVAVCHLAAPGPSRCAGAGGCVSGCPAGSPAATVAVCRGAGGARRPRGPGAGRSDGRARRRLPGRRLPEGPAAGGVSGRGASGCGVRSGALGRASDGRRGPVRGGPSGRWTPHEARIPGQVPIASGDLARPADMRSPASAAGRDDRPETPVVLRPPTPCQRRLAALIAELAAARGES